MSDLRSELPNIVPALFDRSTQEKLASFAPSNHPPRFLLLYGSLRDRSFSGFRAQEAARLLEAMGGETRMIPVACRCRTRRRKRIPRCRNCASWRSGRKAWSGVRQSGTER